MLRSVATNYTEVLPPVSLYCIRCGDMHSKLIKHLIWCTVLRDSMGSNSFEYELRLGTTYLSSASVLV